MSDNNLRIKLGATLDTKSAINDINVAISELQNHKAIKKLDIKMELDQSMVQSINNFIKSIEKLKTIIADQNRVVSQQVRVYEELDGTIRTVTQSTLANGEVVEKTRVKHKRIRDELEKEAGSAENLAGAIEELNQAQRDSYSITKDKNGNIISSRLKETDGYTTTTTNIDGSGAISSTTELTNYKKEREEILREQERANKEAIALDKAHYQALQQQREEDLKHYKNIEAQRAKVADLIRRYGDDKAVEAQFTKVKEELDAESLALGEKIKNTYEDVDLNKLAGLDTQLKNITATTKTARSHVTGMKEAFDEAFNKFPIWMIASTAFYGSLRALRSAVTVIVDIDSQMTELRRVMDEDTNFEKVLSNSIELSQELGRSLSDTLSIMGEFAKQGFNDVESETLSETAMLMQNISDMTADEAVDALTSAMIAFNIEAKDSLDVADSINQVDNDFSVTSQTLAQALQSAGSTAATFGVQMETMLGHVTAIGSVTRESGSVIGNSLKTIYSRLTTLADSATVLESVGVAVNDLNGEVRDGEDILSDLNGVWSSLTDSQRQNIGVTVAGKHICPLAS